MAADRTSFQVVETAQRETPSIVPYHCGLVLVHPNHVIHHPLGFTFSFGALSSGHERRWTFPWTNMQSRLIAVYIPIRSALSGLLCYSIPYGSFWLHDPFIVSCHSLRVVLASLWIVVSTIHPAVAQQKTAEKNMRKEQDEEVIWLVGALYSIFLSVERLIIRLSLRSSIFQYQREREREGNP